MLYAHFVYFYLMTQYAFILKKANPSKGGDIALSAIFRGIFLKAKSRTVEYDSNARFINR